MPVVFLIIKKFAPYLKYIGTAALIMFLIFIWWGKRQENSKLQLELDTYKRQMAGQLTQKEQQLEAANLELGLAKSKLMDQQDLLKAYASDKVAQNAKFEKFKKDYQLQLESYQKTIAQLQEQLHGGTTTIIGGKPRLPTDPRPNVPGSDHIIDPQKEVLPYDWKSDDGRFELDDPDLFVSGNEQFKLHQNFRITGEVYKQKNGFLKTERLTLEEVVIVGYNKDGSPVYKNVATAQVADSKFNYTEAPPNEWWPHKGIFGVWGTVSATFGLHNGVDPRLLIGTGIEFIHFKGLGFGPHLYLDPKVVGDSGFGLELSYRPTIKNVQLNIGVNLGVMTTFTKPFDSVVPMAGLVFYLW